MKYKYIAFLIFAIFFFFIFNYKSAAQSSRTIVTPIEFGLEAHAGFVLKHTKKLDPIPIGTPYGFQFYYQRNTIGTKPWQQLYRYPSYGFSLALFDLGNKSILGQAALVIAYLQINMLRTKLSAVTWSFGTGIAYCNTVYNAETNRLNQAISANLNYTMQTQFAFNNQLTPRIKLKAAAGMTHISNGSIKKPNLGINIPSASLGVFYNPYSTKVSYRKDSISLAGRPVNLTVAYQVSFSRLDTTSKKLYPAHIVSIYLSKKVSHLHSFLLGVDGIYDYAVMADIKTQKGWGLELESDRTERVALVAGHELSINHFALTSQFCYYVYKPFKSKTWAYQRFQLKYYVTKNIFAACALRTHFGTADGIEFAAGLKL